MLTVSSSVLLHAIVELVGLIYNSDAVCFQSHQDFRYNIAVSVTNQITILIQILFPKINTQIPIEVCKYCDHLISIPHNRVHFPALYLFHFTTLHLPHFPMLYLLHFLKLYLSP